MATIFMMLAVSSWAGKINPNCENVKIHLGMGIDDHFEAKAEWRTMADFPKPSKVIEVGDNFKGTDPSFNFTCPDFSASYDSEIVELKGKTYEALLDRIVFNPSKNDYRLDLFSHSWYRYPSIYEGRNNNRYGINIKDFELESGAGYFPIEEGNKIKALNSDIPSHAVIGYKVNNGAIKPLLYESLVSNYKEDLKNADTIDIFHHNPDAGNKGEDIQRIYIDKKAGILKVYRNYDFPQK